MYTMKQVADKMDISVHTLRFYTNKGLFPNITRDVNGVRIFSEDDLDWVHIVQCLRKTGMPVKDIKYYVNLYLLGDNTAPERYRMVLSQKEKAERDLEVMKERIEHLSHKAEWYEELIRSNTMTENE